MTQTTISTAAAGARDLGLVGGRQLHAVQLLDIGRLTSHVIPFVPGTFIAISGRGPKGDSNESGKTTFLAATSLLLGDAEWKLRSGGQHAVTLLFNPHAVGAAEHLADAADHGYIIGLFANPGEPPSDPISVWLRINRNSPYLEVKAQHGESFVDPEGTRPAQLAADDQWAQITHLGGRPLGASGFVEALYGNAPRCIAHLTKRGALPSGVSLLNTNAGAFTREQIGAALVSLAGRQDILDDDRSQRSTLDSADRTLTSIREESLTRERDYERQLAELDGRDRARQLLATATYDWETHDARRYIDALEGRTAKQAAHEEAQQRRRELEHAAQTAIEAAAALSDDQELRDRHATASSELAEADQRLEAAIENQLALEQSVTTTRESLRDLQAHASGWQGPEPSHTEAAARDAAAALTAADQHAAIAGADLKSAQELLAQAHEGRSDAAATLDTLRDAGIPAQGLLDGVTFDQSEQPTLEPLLWPYRDAAVVADNDLAAAIEALANHPWAMLISGPADHQEPTGVATSPAAARRFLTELTARANIAANPDRASDAELGVTVIAGSDGLAGRDARVRAATLRAQEAELAFTAAEVNRREAALVAEALTDDHRRAVAAAEAAAVAEQLKRREDDLEPSRV
jgi:chromosome segregation protein